jgi:hypothetical protein
VSGAFETISCLHHEIRATRAAILRRNRYMRGAKLSITAALRAPWPALPFTWPVPTASCDPNRWRAGGQYPGGARSADAACR